MTEENEQKVNRDQEKENDNDDENPISELEQMKSEFPADGLVSDQVSEEEVNKIPDPYDDYDGYIKSFVSDFETSMKLMKIHRFELKDPISKVMIKYDDSKKPSTILFHTSNGKDNDIRDFILANPSGWMFFIRYLTMMLKYQEYKIMRPSPFRNRGRRL